MKSISKIERERNISFPEIYRIFYDLCSITIPKNLVGTSLLNENPELNEWASELLEEDGVENFLEANDVVFMMHQGYIFYYFKADGNPDPIVYGYYEKKLQPDEFGKLSDFLNEFGA